MGSGSISACGGLELVWRNAFDKVECSRGGNPLEAFSTHWTVAV